jgi:Gpi18-like mannosyltransferase
MILPKQTRGWLHSPISLLLLLGILIMLFALAYQPQRQIALDVTARSSDKFLDHFYPTEDGARWTEARSGVWLPGLGGGNLAWRIGLRLSGAGRGRFDPHAHVVVTVDGTKLGELSLSSEQRDYELDIPPWTLGLNGDVSLEIDASTFKSPIDQRDLGVQIANVWLIRAHGFALPSLRGFLLTIALVGFFALVLRMLSTVGFESKSPPTWKQFFDPWQNRVAWLLVAVWVAIVVACTLSAPHGAWWLQTITFGALLITVSVWLIARIIPASLTQKELLRVLILFMLAALIRIPFDLGRGYPGDVAYYLSLAWKMVSYGIHSAYVKVDGWPPSDNPPVLLYPFWFLGWLYEQLLSPLFGRTRLGNPDMLRFMLRLPGLLGDLLAGALIFRVVRQGCSGSFKPALVAATAYLFNPALIFDSAYWGQTAAVHALFMLLSLIAVDRRAYAWAGGALATAILTKPQAIAIAPVVLLFAFGDRALLRFSAAGAGAAFLITAPFIVAGNGGAVVQQYASTATYHPFISVNGHNFWWFVSGGRGWLHDTDTLGPITFRTAGFLLFGCATLLSLVLVWRKPKMLFLAGAYQSVAFFMLNTQIHENHLLAAFAPLVIAVVFDRRLWWFYGAFALTSVVNMTLHDPKLFVWLGYPSNELLGGPALAFPQWLNSAVQVLLFVAFTVMLVMPLMADQRLKLTHVQH